MPDSYPMPPPDADAAPPANPYAAPSADSFPQTVSLAEAERIRNELIQHEASVKSVGSLYLLGCAFFVFSAVFTFVLDKSTVGGDPPGDHPGVLIVMLVIAALYFWIGRGLRQLDGRVRTPAMVLTAFGLLGFPIGTAISAYFLYLLGSEKGKRVLCASYQPIVAATPHIRYRSPWLVVALGVVILFVVVIVLIIASATR